MRIASNGSVPEALGMLRAARFVILIGLFVLPFVPLYVAPSMLYPYVSGKGFASRMITEVILAAWILLALGDRSFRPRRSALIAALIAFLAIVGLGNVFGVDPGASFFGDITRMDGYLALLHWLALFLVAGSFLAAEDLGERFLTTTVIASSIVCAYSFVEFAQNVAAGRPRQRLEATLGNPTFLGTYILIQLFILVFLTVRLGTGDDEKPASPTRANFWGWPARLLIGLHLVVLFLSGTRGAVLGLVAGASVAIIISAAFEKRHGASRAGAREAVGALIIVLIGFIVLEASSDLPERVGLIISQDASRVSVTPGRGPDQETMNPATGGIVEPSLPELDAVHLAPERSVTGLVQRVSTPLRRMARVGTGGSVQIRLALWEMAQEGFWDRPLTGWGQENFGILADRHFPAAFPSEDEWVDRPHNTLLEWFVNGGVLGGVAYLAIFLAAGWVIWRPGSIDDASVTQRAVLTGLLFAYLVNNFFLFDTIPSYLAFFSVLAYLHAVNTRRTRVPVTRGIGSLGIAAAAILLLAATAWLLHQYNVRPILAVRAGRRAVMLLALSPEASLSEFRRALGYGTFADPTVREQLLTVAVDPRTRTAPGSLPVEFAELAEIEWEKEIRAHPERSRVRAYMGILMQETGQPQRAVVHLVRAAELSPTRRGHYFRLANVYWRTGRSEAALEWAARGYALDPSRRRSTLQYAAMAVYTGREDLVEDLLLPLYGTTLVRNEELSRAYIAAGRETEIIDRWRAMVRKDPQDLEARRSLAEFLLLAGRNDEATMELRTLQLLSELARR